MTIRINWCQFTIPPARDRGGQLLPLQRSRLRLASQAPTTLGPVPSRRVVYQHCWPQTFLLEESFASEGDRALSAAPRLRRLVADTIMASPDTYSEVVLGKPPREYAEWIVDPQHWGGQIELTVRARILFENFSIAFQF